MCSTSAFTCSCRPGRAAGGSRGANVDGRLRQGPLSASREEARSAAELLGREAMSELARYAPDRADRLVADLAGSPERWSRSVLVETVGHRLADVDRERLATTADPALLVDTMKAAGVLAPATMLDVLHAEGVDGPVAAGLVPALGLPVADAIRKLHDGWRMDRLDAGTTLGATVDELRPAGCTPVELLAAAPRETLRSLDARESTWTVAAATLLEAGFSAAEAVGHLVAHAPTPAACAAGVTAIVERPVEAFAYAVRRGQPEDLAALSERYSLDPDTTARTMVAAGVATQLVVDVVGLRCEHDPFRTAEVLTPTLGDSISISSEWETGVNCPVTVLTPWAVGRSHAGHGVDL